MEIVIPVDEMNPDWMELLSNELAQRDASLVQAWLDEVPGGYHIRVRYAGEVLSPNDVLELQLAMVGEEGDGMFWPEVTLDDTLLEEEPTETDLLPRRARIPA